MTDDLDVEVDAGAVACSVLTPVFNEERHIAASVAAMLEQQFPGRLEFLLIDGCSTDGTRQRLAALADADDRIRLLENPRRTTPSSLNLGLRDARGRWVARMDAHTEYPLDYLARGVERLRRGDTRWVSGPQVPVGHNRVSRAIALALRTPLGRGASKRWGPAGAADTTEYELDSGVFGGVWERKTLLEYGGWDEGWPRNQDSEMAGRFLARGEKLVAVSAMAASYAPRGSLKSLWRQYFQYGEFRAKTAVRHAQTMRRSHLLAPMLVLDVLAAIAAPRPLRGLARAGVGVYATTLAAAGAKALGDAEHPLDAALVPVVLPVMHLAHGTGALRGTARYGLPVAAIADALGRGQAPARPGTARSGPAPPGPAPPGPARSDSHALPQPAP